MASSFGGELLGINYRRQSYRAADPTPTRARKVRIDGSISVPEWPSDLADGRRTSLCRRGTSLMESVRYEPWLPCLALRLVR